jgi:hypothetical protein
MLVTCKVITNGLRVNSWLEEMCLVWLEIRLEKNKSFVDFFAKHF